VGLFCGISARFVVIYQKVRRWQKMMYPFMQLDDNTEIVHSELLEDDKVRVYIEKPVEGGFFSAT